jgi:hypothetical protein
MKITLTIQDDVDNKNRAAWFVEETRASATFSFMSEDGDDVEVQIDDVSIQWW